MKRPPSAATAALAFERGNRAHQAGDLATAEAGYREALAAFPSHVEALHMLGVLNAQRGRFDEAEARLRQALAAGPGNAGIHANLANVLGSRGRHDEAIALYDRAIALDPSFADAYLNRARALKDAGRTAEAIDSAERATRLRPDLPEARVLLGMVLASAGRADEAVQAFERAIELRPSQGDAHLGLGLLLWSAGRTREALVAFERAIAADPGSARAWVGRSEALRALGHARDAFASAEQALRLAASFAHAHCARGLALADLGQRAEALASLDRALALQPGLAEAENGRGTILHQSGRLPEALAAFDRALGRQPGHAPTLANRAVTLADLGRAPEAFAAFDEALRLAPDAAQTWVARAVVRQDLGQYAGALEDLDRALACDPAHAEGAWNACLLHLRQGDFARGAPAYDALRWRLVPGIVRLARAEPEWDGRYVDGTLLAWSEQGIGDQVLHLGMLADLARHARHVVVAASPKLLPLAARSFPGIRCIGMDAAAREPCNAHVPLGSLLRHLRPSWAAFDGQRARYLEADAARAAAYRAALPAGALLCGLSWTSIAPALGTSKSIALEALQPLLGLPGACFVDLQYTDSRAERGSLRASGGPALARPAGLDPFVDVDGAAALVEACDIVVTVSNTTAHLAGALGKPTLLLLPFSRGSHWYWHDGRQPCPWYPSVRIARQSSPGDWSAPLAAARRFVEEALAGAVNPPARPSP